MKKYIAYALLFSFAVWSGAAVAETPVFGKKAQSAVTSDTSGTANIANTSGTSNNANALLGGTWIAPGNIGTSTPAIGNFTTVTTTGVITGGSFVCGTAADGTRFKAGGKLGTTVGPFCTATTSEEALYSGQINAGMLGQNGTSYVLVDIGNSTALGSSSKTIKYYVAGTVIGAQVTGTAANMNYYGRLNITRIDANTLDVGGFHSLGATSATMYGRVSAPLANAVLLSINATSADAGNFCLQRVVSELQ